MQNSLNVTTDQFLSTMFDPNDTVCLRVFDDRKGGTFRGLKMECEAGKFPALVPELQRHNAQNRGVFFVVNSGGHNDNEISRINAQFVESDEGTFEEQWERIDKFPLPPSLVVQTRKSLHCYWLVKNADVSRFRHIQKQLVAQFNGDPACVNESRLLRLPGFNHCKKDPVPVEVVLFAPERRYTQKELSDILPVIPDGNNTTASPGKVSGTRKGIAQVGKRCDFIQFCKDNAATLPENLWYAMISNLAVFEDGDKIIHALSKGYPKYSYNETQHKIAHFLESGTKPMTCAKICDSGFSCPKFAQGGCDCKSPAALAFKPLSVTELTANLNLLEKSTVPLENIQAASDFIKNYLYNIDSITAETLINYDIKSKFDFKANDIRQLLAVHREIFKRYSDSKETRRAVAKTEVPDWYEITDKGGLRFLPGALADHMSKNVNAFYGAASFYFYDHGVYSLRDDLQAFASVRSFTMTRNAKSAEIADAEKQWRAVIWKPIREINSNPFIINVKNGLYNVLDDSFREHSPDYFSTVQINANYDPSAECPQFLSFLSDVLPKTEHNLIQEILGYMLIPVNKAQKAFVMVGAANAGKSTLLSIVQDILLGSENVSNIPWQGLSDRFNKAEMFGKLANIFADLPSKAIDDGGWFKALTGEDYIQGECKGKDPFNFKPYARFLFSCNDMPKNYADRSDGFYRRLLIIRFNQSISASRRDPNLREKIACERDGILTWAVAGLKRLIQNNYDFSETDATRFELQRYKIESNSALMFVEENCEIGDGFECVRETMFEKYKDYCTKNGFKPMSQTNFNRDVEGTDGKICRARDKVGSRHIWRGIRLSG
jgi:putative DNA primase/helicase